MPSPIDSVLARLDGVQRAGKGFKARCPAHPDRSPSLSLKECDDGRVLIHCFAGCEPAAVLEAVSLNMAHLFPPSPGSEKKVPKLQGISDRDLRQALELEKQILFIVKADQAKGKAISPTDWERGKLALQRIKLAGRLL